MYAARSVVLLLAGAVAIGCSSAPPAGGRDPSSGRAGRNSGTVIAEIALSRGDCRRAAEAYAEAVRQSRDVALAQRATEVATQCEHWPARARAAQRWRALVPHSPDALRAVAFAALGQHRLAAAEEALRALLSQSGADADQLLAELVPAAVEASDADAAFAALRAAAPLERLSAVSLVLLGQLAFDAYDFAAARRLAARALARDRGSAAAQALIARTYAAEGEDEPALAAARAAARLDAGKSEPPSERFAPAETLATLDRLEETRRELEQLQEEEGLRAEAQRRLALLAYGAGDFEEAERRFMERLERGEGSGEAVYYLALIAERQEDYEQSLRAYALLESSGLADLARPRAARVLLKSGDRVAALSMLDDYVAEHPESAVRFAIAKAQILAENGEAEQAVAIVDAALERHPGHPQLGYEHAVMLERAGRTREAIGAFERLLAEREHDPTVLNALGYTLADHAQDLDRAEQLIRRALEATPDHPAVLDSLGWVRFRRGDAAEARRLLERAYVISGDPEIAAHWGEVLWASGGRNEARKVWVQALARHPDAEPLRRVLERFVPARPQ